MTYVNLLWLFIIANCIEYTLESTLSQSVTELLFEWNRLDLFLSVCSGNIKNKPNSFKPQPEVNSMYYFTDHKITVN
jgi:hypothetical protein